MIRLSVVLVLLSSTTALPCSGCSCRGGPGYRGPDGKCVGWGNIGAVCGSPPTTRCTPEGPNAGASDAAEYGVKALSITPNHILAL
jgi:hypothetical protein